MKIFECENLSTMYFNSIFAYLKNQAFINKIIEIMRLVKVTFLTLFIGFLITLVTQSFAQISCEGVPPSFSEEGLTERVEFVDLVPLSRDMINQIDDNLETSPGPYRIGKTIPVNLSIETAGTWSDLALGGKVWRLTLHSKNALALSLYFDQFWLPGGGELYVYNEMRNQVIGAFTDLNNDESGLFATEIIQGETLTIEYYQPEEVTETAIISISDMAYVIRGVSFTIEEDPDSRGGSLWCMINVNCEEGDNWQEEKRGVVRQYMILPGGWIAWCSGSLINNTAWDLKPYVLTAHHCGEDCTPTHFNQWIFYYKYESATCSGTSGSQSYTQVGCALKAEGDRYTGSDFQLLEINQDPPSDYEPYWNGWNRSEDGSLNGVSIHHPAGDIKKISTYHQALTQAQWNNNGVLSHWKNIWGATTNGTSIVEEGSSGSPLFDSDHNIVGDLSGSPINQSCTNTSYSLYGGIYWSWDQMGNAPAQQLKYWLDPEGTGEMFVNGTEGIAPSANFSADDPTVTPGSTIQFYDESLHHPDEWSWSFPGGEPSSSTEQNPQVTYDEIGSYSVTLTASNFYGSDNYTRMNYVQVGIGPEADFSSDETEISAGQAVYFYDESVGSPNGWHWTFDGATPGASFIENPGPIYYNDAGVYPVKLISSNDFGSDEIIKEEYITVYGPPNADFGADSVNIPIGYGVNFEDLSTGSPTSWEWTFEGGIPSSSTAQNPQDIVYNESGEYTVTLVASSEYGSDEIIKTDFIHVIPPPEANFTCANRYVVVGETTTFTDGSTGDPTTFLWEFEGGSPATSNQKNPGEIQYNDAGDFDVSLTVSNPYGSTSSSKPNYIHVGYVPEAAFSADNVLIGAGESVNFSDETFGNPSSWAWTFEGGDPSTSTVRNPENIVYNAMGNYDVSLTVTNTYGEDSETMQNFISVGYVGVDNPVLSAQDVYIFPNPTTGMVNVSFKGDVSNILSISAYNSIGDRVFEINSRSQIEKLMQIDLSEYQPGIYYLNIQTESDVILKKITLTQ